MHESSPAHLAAMQDSQNNYTAWQHNVTDALKSKTEDEIKEQLKQTAHPFAVCFEHWIGELLTPQSLTQNIERAFKL